MYKTILVEKQIEDGLKLLRALESRGVPVDAAVWFQDPDRMVWKLIFVTSLVSAPGPNPYLHVVSAITDQNLNFSPSDIRLMSPQSGEFSDLKRNLEGVVGSAGIKPKDPSTGTVFDDAYIYRWPD
jgi:hypothetical protein